MSHSIEVKVRNQPFYLEADRDNRKLISSVANTGTAYYSTNQAVSDTSYQGVLSAGQDTIIQRGTWFYSPNKARLRIISQPKVEPRRKFNSLAVWGHSYSFGAAGGGFAHSHFVPKVAVNLLGAQRVESRSVSGSRWTENRLRDGVNPSTFTRETGSSWVDMAHYATQRHHNWPSDFSAAQESAAYMFMHGCNDYHTLGPDAVAAFVNPAEFACHLALARANWYQSDLRSTDTADNETPAAGIDLSGPTTLFADYPYWSVVSGDTGSAEAKTDRNTGTNTWAVTSDSVQRVQLPNWSRLEGSVSPTGVSAPVVHDRTVGITFIIDPATDGNVTITRQRDGHVTGPISLSATGQTRPITGAFPTSSAAPKTVRIPDCRSLDELHVAITDVTGKVQIDAFGVELDRHDYDAPLVIWNIQPKLPSYFFQTPFSSTDELYDAFTEALQTMLDTFPPQLVRAVNHDHRHIKETMLDTVHPSPNGNDLMVLNIRDVVAPGLPDKDALRPPGGDDEWRLFGTSEDDYENIAQANAFDIIPAAGFRKRLNGTVELRGVMGRDTDEVAQDVIANLPLGFRPHERWVHFDVRVGHLGASYEVGRIRIEAATGNIIFSGLTTGTADAFPQFYLDGLIFEAQQ